MGHCVRNGTVYEIIFSQAGPPMQPHKSTISIRKADAGDAQGILDCLREAFAEFRNNYTLGAFHDTVLTPQDLANRLATMSVFIATVPAGEIVGTISCNVVGPTEGHIRGMAIRTAWHGGEVAGELLRTAELALRQGGCSRITLDTTLPLQRAMRFYEKNGFRRSGRITDFFGMELLEYVKTLDT